mmetsp:Transcript_5552/g.16099  ORF Transcript_5552/g.16099 Transcript_5552/m.16099 type:complete len:158 (-) Transcript_5552:277-750(-)
MAATGRALLRPDLWSSRKRRVDDPFEKPKNATSGKSCTWRHNTSEDVYFSTLLKGIGAPLPTSYEAALFSVESIPLDQFESIYKINNDIWKMDRQLERWGNTEMPSTPVGLHKPTNRRIRDRMCEPEIQQTCKYLPLLVGDDIDCKEPESDGGSATS